MEKIIFEAIDADGRKVICTESQWIEHICNPKNGREYLLDSDEDITEFVSTIETANAATNIFIDRDNEKKLIYLQKSKRGNYYNRVVVEFVDSTYTGTGKVTTAFQPTNVRDGDRPLWLR